MVARAVAARCRTHHADTRYEHLTQKAIRKRVAALPYQPRLFRGGWWLIGQIVGGAVNA